MKDNFPDYLDVVLTILFCAWVLTSIGYGLVYWGYKLKSFEEISK